MRVIIAHTIEHVRAALAASRGKPVILQSAPDAVHYAGSLYLLRMFEQARQEHPDAEAIFILDCRDAGATAIEAMRAGHKHIRPSEAKIADIARNHGVTVHDGPYEALDLHTVRDTKDACIKWLEGAHESDG